MDESPHHPNPLSSTDEGLRNLEREQFFQGNRLVLLSPVFSHTGFLYYEILSECGHLIIINRPGIAQPQGQRRVYFPSPAN